MNSEPFGILALAVVALVILIDWLFMCKPWGPR